MVSPDEDARFREAVDRSWEAARAFGDHMLRKGYGITLNPPRMRPCFEQRPGYGDEFDLAVVTRYEVKGRNIDFTSAEDFPFPTIFVDRKDKADRNAGVVHAYVTLNKAQTHAAVIKASTRLMWRATEKFDATKGHNLTLYECPKEHASFITL